MVIIGSFQHIDNLCPVCAFEMDDPPRDYNICPSCGTEFGVHDVNASIAELRQAWLKAGPKWWSTSEQEPQDWNPFSQLARLGLSSGPVVPTKVVFTVTSATGAKEVPQTIGWLGYGERPWDQFVNRQSALELLSAPSVQGLVPTMKLQTSTSHPLLPETPQVTQC